LNAVPIGKWKNQRTLDSELFLAGLKNHDYIHTSVQTTCDGAMNLSIFTFEDFSGSHKHLAHSYIDKYAAASYHDHANPEKGMGQ
jgi:hypothetical protein